jgi:hypothetical protein
MYVNTSPLDGQCLFFFLHIPRNEMRKTALPILLEEESMGMSDDGCAGLFQLFVHMSTSEG